MQVVDLHVCLHALTLALVFQAHEASVVMQVLPRVVSIPSSPTASDDAKDVMAIACGNRFTLAACQDGSVQWWGQTPAGFELHGTVTCSKPPQHTAWLPKHGRHVRKLAAGNSHALMLLEKEHEQEETIESTR